MTEGVDITKEEQAEDEHPGTSERYRSKQHISRQLIPKTGAPGKRTLANARTTESRMTHVTIDDVLNDCTRLLQSQINVERGLHKDQTNLECFMAVRPFISLTRRLPIAEPIAHGLGDLFGGPPRTGRSYSPFWGRIGVGNLQVRKGNQHVVRIKNNTDPTDPINDFFRKPYAWLFIFRTDLYSEKDVVAIQRLLCIILERWPFDLPVATWDLNFQRAIQFTALNERNRLLAVKTSRQIPVVMRRISWHTRGKSVDDESYQRLQCRVVTYQPNGTCDRRLIDISPFDISSTVEIPLVPAHVQFTLGDRITTEGVLTQPVYKRAIEVCLVHDTNPRILIVLFYQLLKYLSWRLHCKVTSKDNVSSWLRAQLSKYVGMRAKNFSTSGEYGGLNPWKIQLHPDEQRTKFWPGKAVAEDVVWDQEKAIRKSKQTWLPMLSIRSIDARHIVKVMEVLRGAWRASGSYLHGYERACQAADVQNASIEDGEEPEPMCRCTPDERATQLYGCSSCGSLTICADLQADETTTIGGLEIFPRCVGIKGRVDGLKHASWIVDILRTRYGNECRRPSSDGKTARASQSSLGRHFVIGMRLVPDWPTLHRTGYDISLIRYRHLSTQYDRSIVTPTVGYLASMWLVTLL